jgi:hypothetical protein
MFQISDTIFIKLECVEGVGKEDGEVFVFMKSGSIHKSNVPFEALKSIVDINTISEENKRSYEEKPNEPYDINKQFVSL